MCRYEAAFLRIQDATGVENIDELIKQFIDSENKSYELFQLVNQRTEEADVKQAQVRALQDEVAKVKGVDASSAAGDRRKRLDQAYALQRLHKVLEDKACKHDEVTKSLRQIYGESCEDRARPYQFLNVLRVGFFTACWFR